jgi:hypothetical protein
VDVGIDFVGDPVIGEEDGEERTDEPKDPATREPGVAEFRFEERDVNEIDSGVTKICEDCERQHGPEIREMKRRTEVRPRGDEPDEANGEEDEVVEDAARLPEAGGGEKESAECGVRLGGDGGGGHDGLPVKLSGEYARALRVVKYFIM